MPTAQQTNPLEAFYSATGATGNKTTNADLPQWLKDLGMKGDAYAGGMLKPELRYGFKYKGGKIHFADGTSFAAKKQKDGSYSYSDASGAAQSYSPTDEQNAYNQAYKKSTSNQSFLDKAQNTIKFELDHGLQLLKGVAKDPRHLLFGVDPLGAKIGSAVTGKRMDPLVDQLGGALDSRYADYENRTGNALGYAKPMQDVAHVIAGTLGGGALSGLAGGAASAASGAASGALGAGSATAPTVLGSLLGALGSNPDLVNNLVSTGSDVLSPHNPGTVNNPFAGLTGTQGTAPGGTPSMGAAAPLTMDMFPQSGFRDQAASDYLKQALGLAPGTPMPPAPPDVGNGMAPPSGLDAFAGMDFSSLFQGLLPPGQGSFGLPGGTPGGTPKTIQPLPSSSPKTPPMGYAAVNDGTRGPDMDPASIISSLAGAFGNGGAAMRTLGTRQFSK